MVLWAPSYISAITSSDLSLGVIVPSFLTLRFPPSSIKSSFMFRKVNFGAQTSVLITFFSSRSLRNRNFSRESLQLSCVLKMIVISFFTSLMSRMLVTCREMSTWVWPSSCWNLGNLLMKDGEGGCNQWRHEIKCGNFHMTQFHLNLLGTVEV